MKSSLYYYHQQNEMCLKIVLSPFILAIFIIKKLVQFIKSRYAARKH